MKRLPPKIVSLPERVESAPIIITPGKVSCICEYKRLKYLNSKMLIDPNINKYYYNACLLPNNRIFYRVGKEPKGFEDKIATCLLNDDLTVIPNTNKYISVHSNWSESTRGNATLIRYLPFQFKDGEHVEDPRAIITGCAYFVFYTDGLNIGVSKLNLNCDRVYSNYLTVPDKKYKFDFSDGREKNWIPFVSNNKIYVLYGVSPLIYFECLDTGTSLKIDNVHVYKERISWPFSHIRGGTPPVEYDNDKLLWCFHSTMQFDTHAKQSQIHYMFSVYVTENTFPFKFIKMCKLPLLIGIPSHASTTLSLQNNVVFPCGMVEIDGGWRISMGINDYEIAFLDITEEDLLW
jgi:predicted GH43/DUF377 family glycosyl hydrolase